MLYLVIEPENIITEFRNGENIPIVITDAESEQDALWTYAMTVGGKDYDEYAVYDRAVNGCGLIAHAYMSTKDERDAWDYHQELVADEETAEQRICDFFGEHEDWAKLYFAMLEDESHDEEILRNKHPFPKEMLAYMFIKAVEDNWSYVRIIPVKSIEKESIKSMM